MSENLLSEYMASKGNKAVKHSGPWVSWTDKQGQKRSAKRTDLIYEMRFYNFKGVK